MAEELHFTRSASRLFLSQSGLSRRIDLLERATGQQLLHRSTREVALTDAGVTLVPHVEAIMLSALAASHALKALWDSGPRSGSSLMPVRSEGVRHASS